jgi:RsmE family RNA methyltransferase
MNIVLFTEKEINEPLALFDERAAHIRTVLHKKVGDIFEAGIINGQAGTALITSIDESKTDGGKLRFTFTPLTDGKPLFPVKVIIGFPRPIQLKRLFRDMAGIGVEEIHLAGTELGEKSYMQSTLFEHGAAEALLCDGSAQAKSTHVPKIFLHQTLAACLEHTAQTSAGSILAALDNVSPEMPLMRALKQSGLKRYESSDGGTQQKVVAAIGNERGWTDNERAQLKAAGFTLCGMGERVLRTETAATTAVSLILSAMEVL